MKGLVKEGEILLKAEGDADVRDAGLIGAAQRVEHYEMAGYGTARSLARRLGENQVAATLQQTLNEEAEANKEPRFIAKSSTWAVGSPGARCRPPECESVNDSRLRCAAKSRRDSYPRDPRIPLGNVTFCRRSAANDRHISPRQRSQAKQLSSQLHMRRKVIRRPESTAECTAHPWHLLTRRNRPGARPE
jgi:Domain of unknown function (DUF892)